MALVLRWSVPGTCMGMFFELRNACKISCLRLVFRALKARNFSACFLQPIQTRGNQKEIV